MFLNQHKLCKFLTISVVNCCFSFNVIANEFRDEQKYLEQHHGTTPKYTARVLQDDQESNKNTSWYSKFTSWLPSSNCLQFNKRQKYQLVYCVFIGTTLLLVDYTTAQSASTASNAQLPPPPPPPSSSSACDTSRYNLYLNIAQLGVLTVGSVIGLGKVCYNNIVQNYNDKYGYSKGACLRNFCISGFCCCWSREEIENYIIVDTLADETLPNPVQPLPSATPASGILQSGLLGAPVNNNVFNLSGGNPSGHPSHIFNLGTNTVHPSGLKSKRQLAGNSKLTNSHYKSQQDDVAIDINEGIHSGSSGSISSSSTSGSAHNNVNVQNPTNDHVVDVKDDNNDNGKAEISVEN